MMSEVRNCVFLKTCELYWATVSRSDIVAPFLGDMNRTLGTAHTSSWRVIANYCATHDIDVKKRQLTFLFCYLWICNQEKENKQNNSKQCWITGTYKLGQLPAKSFFWLFLFGYENIPAIIGTNGQTLESYTSRCLFVFACVCLCLFVSVCVCLCHLTTLMCVISPR